MLEIFHKEDQARTHSLKKVTLDLVYLRETRHEMHWEVANENDVTWFVP